MADFKSWLGPFIKTLVSSTLQILAFGTHISVVWWMILKFKVHLKSGFHMIVTVSNASPRQAQRHIGDSSTKWKHFLSDVYDITSKTGIIRGHTERVEMS